MGGWQGLGKGGSTVVNFCNPLDCDALTAQYHTFCDGHHATDDDPNVAMLSAAQHKRL